MRNLFNKNSLFIEIAALFILAVTLVPLVWFHGNFVIWGVDTSIGNSNPILRLYSTFFIWKDKINLGYEWPDQGMLFYYAFLGIFQYFGFTLRSQQIILISSLVFMTLFSGWYFGYVLLSKKKADSLVRFSTALFYTFNLVTLTWIWWRFLSWILFYPLFLLFFSLTYDLFSNVISLNKKTLKRVAFIVILLLFFSPAFNSLIAFALLIAILTFIALTFILLDNKFKVGRVLHFKLGLLLLSLILIINSYQIFPQLLMINQLNYTVTQATYLTPVEVLNDASQFTTILNVARLMGEHSMHESFHGDYLYDATWLYRINNNKIFILLTFIPFGSLLFLLLSKEKETARERIIFLFLAIISIFLVKGSNPPFGIVESWAASLRYGVLLRHPYDKFIYILILSITFSFGYLIKRLSITLTGKSFACVILVLVTGVCVYPLWTGANIIGNQDYMHGMKAAIPSSYNDLKNIRNNGSWLQLPMQSAGGDSAYSWKEGVQLNNKSILDDFIDAPVIFQNNSNSQWPAIYKDIINDLSTKQAEDFKNVLTDLNVSTILVNKDYDYKFMAGKIPFTSSIQIDSFLNSLNYLAKVKDNDEYSIYRVLSFSDHIFFLKNINLNSFYKINYRKVSPVQYDIQITSLSQLQSEATTSEIIFNQSTNNGWNLKYVNYSKLSKPVRIENNTKNAWVNRFT